MYSMVNMITFIVLSNLIQFKLHGLSYQIFTNSTKLTPVESCTRTISRTFDLSKFKNEITVKNKEV